MARRQRLRLDGPFQANQTLSLGPERAHRLRAVLRLGPGAPLGLFNPIDGEWDAELVSLGKNDATAQLLRQRVAPPAAPPPPLRLLFAPIKRAAVDWLVEKATELGVARLTPVWTKRAHVERVNLDRLTLIADEAAEQCERLDAPQIDAAVDLARALADWPADAPLYIAAERSDAAPLTAAAQAARPWGPAGCGLLVGPEGGFAPEDLKLALSFPFVRPVTLGPRILRAETAAIAGVTLLQALNGDWARPVL